MPFLRFLPSKRAFDVARNSVYKQKDIKKANKMSNK